MPQPPLLCEEGNAPHSTFLQFVHIFYDRPYVEAQTSRAVIDRPYSYTIDFSDC